MNTTLFSAFAAGLLLLGSVLAAPLEPARWAGVVVDDESAEYTGKWMRTAKQSSLVGKTYHHDDTMDPAAKSARFTPDLPEAGRYEVRLLYVPHVNRATNVAVSVLSDEGETKRTVNQREHPSISGVPRALGVFRFAAGKNGAVVFTSSSAPDCSRRRKKREVGCWMAIFSTGVHVLPPSREIVSARPRMSTIIQSVPSLRSMIIGSSGPRGEDREIIGRDRVRRHSADIVQPVGSKQRDRFA